MGTAESATVSPEGHAAVPDAGRASSVRRWTVLRRAALAIYVVALFAFVASYGVPVQRELVIACTCGALVCVSIGRPWREIGLLAVDWLPLVAFLAVYDMTRGVADSLGMGVNFTPMAEFDRFVFFGQTPTEWLQGHLNSSEGVAWWDVLFTIVYTSYFIVPFALAGILWSRHRASFLQFTRRLLTLAFAGLTTYILFPAAPPWLAAEKGMLEGVQRTTGEGWEVLSVGTASMFKRGQDAVNLVAAVPSLHAAIVALVSMFLWRRVRPLWRPLLVLYPVAMGVTLMATGEHYLFDVLLGWLYAGLVMLGWARWEARRLRSRPAPA